jgi:hypothetical protein
MKALYNFFDLNKDTDTFFIKVKRENGNVIFRIYPATTMLGEVINSLAASLPRTPIEFSLTRMGITPSDNRLIFDDDPLFQRISL